MTGTAVLTAVDGAALARLAAATVRARLAGLPLDGRPPISAVLRMIGASFVTLENGGALRGCIGTLEPVRPLYLDVARNAVRAMSDPRLAPVTAADWPRLDFKISVLSALEEIAVDDRADLVARLQPGVDGLLLSDGQRRATFLPGVWAKLDDPARFVAALLAKGGWPDWPAGVRAFRYNATEFRDSAPR